MSHWKNGFRISKFMLYFLKKAIEGCLIWISSFFISRSYISPRKTKVRFPWKKNSMDSLRFHVTNSKGKHSKLPPGPTVEVGIKLSGWKPQLINSAGFSMILSASFQAWNPAMMWITALFVIVILSQTRWNQDQTYVENVSVPQKIFFSNVNFE